MSEDNSKTVEDEGKMKSLLIKLGIVAALLSVAFLVGFVPMWLQAQQAASDHEVTKKLLRTAELRGLLTSSIVDAGQGEYEPARQEISDFFSSLRAEVNKGEDSALTVEQREKLKPIFDKRDSTVTMLAQRDQTSTQRLMEIYKSYRQAVANTPAASPQPTK